jgi:hypothetical protein
MFKKIFFIMIIMILQTTKQYKCILKENIYFTWGPSYENENITVLTIRTPISNGYSSITFHNNPNNFKDSTTFFSNTTTENLKILSGDNLTKNFTNITNLKEFRKHKINDPQEGDDYFGLQRYYMSIYLNDTKFLQNKKYVTIRYVENNVQNEYTTNFNYFKEFDCLLVYVDNIDFIHPSLTAIKGLILIIMLIVMLTITCLSTIKLPNISRFEKYPKIFKKGIRIQPFYSRGITPYFGLFFISLYYLTCFLQICFDYENNMYFYYLLYNVIVVPSVVAIFTIIPINSLKWIFLLNLNSRKVSFNVINKGILLQIKKIQKVISKNEIMGESNYNV